MNTPRLKILIVVLVFFGALVPKVSFAQTFPVQGVVHLAPPYSPYLSDYIAPGSQKLFIQLLANDVSIVDHPISFRVSIEGVGITIRTKQNIIPSQPLTLFGGGAPTLLYGEDLAEYFNPNNLDFAGFSRRDFDRTGKLPEGIYRFTIEVVSLNRNVVISNKATTMVWIILNDPPLLNLPRKDTKMRIIDPTNMAFTWTPRHTGSPNSAFTTEYIFRLVEIWPANRNPYDAFLSQLPLYEVTTDLTQILYGPAEPALIPGRSYAWQVQAKDSESRDVFKNDGRSEVFVFQYGDALSAPENIVQDNGRSNILNLSWDLPAQGEMPQQYRVRYKKRSEPNGTWYESVTSQRWVTLADLQPDTDYDVRIRSEARPQVSEYSPLVEVRTTAESAAPYACGTDLQIPLPTNTSPLPTLNIGDVITSRNFRVQVTEAKGESGNFSGRGTMPVPFLNMATVNVVFTSIKVNTAYELIQGDIITTYNPGSEMGRVIDDANKIGEPPAPQPADSLNVPRSPDFKVDGKIDSVYVSNGEIIVVDADGNKTTYKQPVSNDGSTPAPVVIADSSGSTYTVASDGSISKVDSNNISGSVAAVVEYPLKKFMLVGFRNNFYLDEWFYCSSQPLPSEHKADFEQWWYKKDKYSAGPNFEDFKFDTDCDIIYDENRPVKVKLAKKESKTADWNFLAVDANNDLKYILNNAPLASLDDLKSALIPGKNVLELQVKPKQGTGLFETAATLKIRYGTSDLSSFKVRVTRGKNKVKYYDHGKLVGNDDEGENKLKLDEVITLELVKHEASGEYTVIEGPKWKIGETIKEGSKIELQIKDYMYHVTVTKDDLLAGDFVLPLVIDVPDTEDHTGVQSAFRVDVLALPEGQRKNRMKMFNKAAAEVQAKDVALYNRFLSSPGLTIFIVPKTDANIPVSGTAKLMGVAIGDISYKSKAVALLDIRYDAATDLDNTVMKNSCTLVAKLSDTELEQVQIACKKKEITDMFDKIDKRISEDVVIIKDAEKLRNQVMAADVNEQFAGGIAYKVKEDEASKYITVGKNDMKIYLNGDEIVSSQSDFNKTLAHELKHLEFAAVNTYEKLKWRIIRDKNATDTKYTLGDVLGSNGHCSAGIGHEKYNPENKDVCDVQNNY